MKPLSTGAPRHDCRRLAIGSGPTALACALLALAAPAVAQTPDTQRRELPGARSGSDDEALRRLETQRMVRRLEFIAESANPWANPYHNAARVEALRKLPRPADARSRELLDYRLALELLRDGRSAEAATRLRALEPTLGPSVKPMLAAALLRQGEQDNCIARHTSDSCLLPIRDRGVYVEQQQVRAAIVELLELLEADPEDLTARWLLNVACMAAGDYPDKVPPRWLVPPEVFRSDLDIGRFPDVAPALGLDVVGLAGGVITEDFDGDDDLDLMVSSSGLRDSLRLFRNNGDGSFTERTDEAGLRGIVGGLNIVHADYDNDGDADVLVLRGAWLGVAPATDGGRHPNSLLRNDGDGTFHDVTESAGLLAFLPSQTASWADYDNDGWLDLFVGNESFGEQQNPSQLFRNNGDGTFSDVALEARAAVVGLVKGVAWGDYDNDGRPDLYVSRLGAPNLLLHNDGPGLDGTTRFREVAASAGVAQPVRSFPTWFWDYDNDGWLDIFVSGYGTGLGAQAADVLADYLGLPTQAERPRLYRNNGDGTFRDVTRDAGLYKLLFTMGCNFGDLDNDGYLDMYLGTGDPDLRALIPNRMFRDAGGSRFQDITTTGGFGHLQKGHGIAFADLDNDGDQDVYTGLGGFFSGDVYQNALFENPGHGNHWILLRLEGRQSNRSAIGARITLTVLEAGTRRQIHGSVTSGGSFGGSSLRQQIGLGAAERIESLAVRWPAGKTGRFEDVPMDRGFVVREGESRLIPMPLRRFVLGGGADDSASAHEHRE